MAEVETGFLSLADLADLNTDDIAALSSRVPPAGLFRARVTVAEGRETPNAEEGKAPNINFLFNYLILGGKAIDKSLDVEKDVKGRTFRESYKIWTGDIASVNESIGLLKGRYVKVGLPVAGRMGGQEGKEPGWFDGAIAFEIDLQVRTFKNRATGQDQAQFDWVKAPAESAGTLTG